MIFGAVASTRFGVTAVGAVGAATAVAREVPRFARWYYRATHI
jgi:hypothetical protein